MNQPGGATMTQQPAGVPAPGGAPASPSASAPPAPQVNFDRLAHSVQWSRKELMPFRTNRLAAIRQYIGRHYSDAGTSDRVPVNMLKLALLIYLRHLVATTPRVMVATKEMQLKPAAKAMEAWINHRMGEVKLEGVLRLAALDALFSVGIIKVGLCCTGHSVEIEGQRHEYGMPFCDVIDLDDWVHDMSAKRWDQIAYCGHRYRVPMDLAKSNQSYDPEVVKTLATVERMTTNEAGDERIETLTTANRRAADFEEYTELWELYLPRQQLIVVLPDNGGYPGSQPLSVRPWVGPKEGPYHLLAFNSVPGNIMPSAPAHDLLDLHTLINQLFLKLGRQAERQKTLLAVPGAASGDGKRIIEANDGEAIRTDFPGQAQEIKTGGIDQNNFLFTTQIRQLFSYLAGNLDTLGGLSPQAQTLGQEQLLAAGSGKLVQAMQEDTVAFSGSVLAALGWYWWTDPLQTYHAQVPLPKSPGYSYDVQITPEMRQADPYKLNFTIDPYSMQHATPQQRVQSIMQLLQQILLPAAPVLAQQGIGINWERLIHKLGEYMNMPDLDEIVVFQEQLAQMAQQQAQQGGGQGGGPDGAGPAAAMPMTSNRNYTRTSVPSGGQQSGENQLMSQLMQGEGNR